MRKRVIQKPRGNRRMGKIPLATKKAKSRNTAEIPSGEIRELYRIRKIIPQERRTVLIRDIIVLRGVFCLFCHYGNHLCTVSELGYLM